MAGLAGPFVGALDATIGPSGACVRARSPLELRGPFHDASYFIRNVTAGVFGGDAYEVDVTAAPGATVRVASSSATKVYSGNRQRSRLEVRLAAEPGATLLWGPHTTIVQSESDYRQSAVVELTGSGRVILGEVLVLGRLARGEQFTFRRLESSLDVRVDGAAVYSEAFELTPGNDLVASMADRGVLASVYLLGVRETGELARLLENEALAGWSALPNGAGAVVRGLCGSLSHGQALVERMMQGIPGNRASDLPAS